MRFRLTAVTLVAALPRDRVRICSDGAATARQRAIHGLHPTFGERGGYPSRGFAPVPIGVSGGFSCRCRFDAYRGACYQRRAQRITADRDQVTLSDADAITCADANARRVRDTGPDDPPPVCTGHTVPDAIPANAEPRPDSHTLAEPNGHGSHARQRRDVPDAGRGGPDLLHRNAGLRERRSRSRRVRSAEHRDLLSRGERRAGRVARRRRR